jgi:cysteine desulfurase
MRDRLWDRLVAEISGTSVNGPRDLRLPGNLNVTFDRVDAEALILALRRFSLSSGSACSSGDRAPSSVLRAIGLSDHAALGSLRIGLGSANTLEQIDLLVEDVKNSVSRVREISVK